MSEVWRKNSTLSHGPLVPVVVAGLLWSQRRQLGDWCAASRPGFGLLLASCLLFVMGCWGDVELLRALSLVGAIFGIVWYMGGGPAFQRAVPALAFLGFMVPWPTSLTERLAFPLQLTSSAYAALLCSLVGQPVHRAGVQLAALSAAGNPIYTVMVTRQCSGLTSITVLLALAYLFAYATRVRPLGKALILLSALPVAVAMNAVRLVIILLAGAHGSAALARWIHDHETPVLIFLCALVLAGIQKFFLGSRLALRPTAEASAPPAAAPRRVGARRLLLACVPLVLALAGGAWADHSERLMGSPGNFLQGLQLPYQEWKTEDRALTRIEQDELQPDSVLIRQYQSARQSDWVELAVISGRHKRSIHSPGSCLVGCGWERLVEDSRDLSISSEKLRVTRSLMVLGSRKLMLTYFFTDGEYSSPQLVTFQAMQLWKRMLPHPPVQALVRITVPVTTTLADAEQRTDEFATEALPPILQRLRDARQNLRTTVGPDGSWKQALRE
jgi:EpsI family protein